MARAVATLASAPGRRSQRRAEVHAFKREAILAAARSIFTEKGLKGTSLRAIAAAAGYVPAALYGYYASREQIYADLLSRSLADLQRAMRDAQVRAPDAAGEVAALAEAFYRFYEERPDELQLGLYIVQGLGLKPGSASERRAEAKGLGPELDRQLNGRLIACLTLIWDAFRRACLIDVDAARRLTLDLAGNLIGTLVLRASGRLSMLGGNAETQVARAVATLLERGRSGSA